jgi:hypothetical protein
MVKVKLLRPSKKMMIVAQPHSLPRASGYSASGYCFSKRCIVCTADKDWNEKIKTSINKLIDDTVAFDAIVGEQMSGTLLCALSLLSPKATCLLACFVHRKCWKFCKICFTKFVEEMWNQDGVTGKKLGIHVNQKEDGDWTFLTCHHCQRANTMNNLLTYYILYR